MKYILSTILICLFFLFSCSINNLSQNDSANIHSGQASLKFNGDRIPSNVISIAAFLTNNDDDTLFRRVNVFSDSSVFINFIGVTKGKWHLKLLAQNREGKVLYTGHDNLLIQSGKTTNVNIDLLPDNKATGSVNVKVNWGKQNINWIDYGGNPIITRLNNPSNPIGVSTAKIIFDKDIYKMVYVCIYNAGKGNIWYAESPDGIKWQNILNKPVFDSDTRGTWDDYTVGPGAIIKDDNGTYKLYYNGWSSQYGKWQVGLAVSSDFIHWHRYTYPILEANESNEFKVGAVSVLKIHNLYYMYYGSNPKDNYNNMKINLALSDDGIHWNKYSGNPILKPSFAWEGAGVTFPAVIYDNNRFVMIYSNEDRTKFGAAYSKDGKTWIKNSGFILSNKMINKKWSQINYPFLIKIGDEYRLYYTATTKGNLMQICLVKTFVL